MESSWPTRRKERVKEAVAAFREARETGQAAAVVQRVEEAVMIVAALVVGMAVAEEVEVAAFWPEAAVAVGVALPS